MLSGGSSVGLLPVSTKEKLSAPLPTIQAHSSNVGIFIFQDTVSNGFLATVDI